METVVSNRFNSLLKLSIQALGRLMEWLSAYCSPILFIIKKDVTDALFYVMHVMVSA